MCVLEEMEDLFEDFIGDVFHHFHAVIFLRGVGIDVKRGDFVPLDKIRVIIID